MIKVLVVDDSALVRKLFGAALAEERDMMVAFARDGADALTQSQSFQPDVITLDVNMPKLNGLDCLDRIMVERPCRVLMVSSMTDHGADATLEALRLGAVDFITKPQGAVSLGMQAFAPLLVQKIRAVAGAQLKASRRLKERVRHRMAGVAGRPPRPASASPSRSTLLSSTGVVLVGISTGGPPALETVLAALPASFPWPIVIAQHMPATFTGSLARRLDAICEIEVVEVMRTTVLRPGCAYIARGDADVVIASGAMGLVALAAPASPDHLWHPSTDRLVRSAMQHLRPEQMIGVLMTGMGDDGAAAMKDLHDAGGHTIAEAKETAVIWGMPGELVKRGGAGWVLPLPKIGDRLTQLVSTHAPHP